MLDQLQDFALTFADTKMQCQLATITEKPQDVRLQRRKHRLKTFSLQNFQCSWYILYDLNIYILKTLSSILSILFCLYYWWIIVRSSINQKIMPGGLGIFQLSIVFTLYLPALDPNLYLPALTPTLCLPQIFIYRLSPGPEFAYTDLVSPISIYWPWPTICTHTGC